MGRVMPKAATVRSRRWAENGGDAVRALNAVAGDGEVGAVEADEGDVGAVQGGDEGAA